MDQIKTIPAEFYGSAIGSMLVNQLLAAETKAEASIAIADALCMAFDHDEQGAIEAIAGGFAGRLVNVLECGIAAIRES